MDKFLQSFFHSNSWKWRLGRTIFQGICGVVLANLDLLLGKASLDPEMRAMVAALVMAILSPIMAGFNEEEK